MKEDLGIKEHDQEGRTLTVEFEKFYLVACYVPNAGQKLVRLDYRTKKWDIAFKEYLNKLKVKIIRLIFLYIFFCLLFFAYFFCLKATKHVILCGDLNVAHEEIDISNPKGNLRSAGFTVEERAEFTKLLATGFVDTFRRLHPKEVKYSYWSARSNARKENKGWRLDYFVVDDDLFKKGGVKESEIQNEIMGSDHCPIEITLELNKI